MQAFREAVEAGDFERVVGLLAEDITFRTPIAFTPYHGREAATAILFGASQVFQGLRYEREIGAVDAPDRALVFRATVGDREVHGCDFIHTNEAGLIDEFTVMVRPLSAAMALAEAMREQLDAARAQGVQL